MVEAVRAGLVTSKLGFTLGTPVEQTATHFTWGTGGRKRAGGMLLALRKPQAPYPALAHSLLEALAFSPGSLKHRTHGYQRLYVNLY